MPLRQGSQIQEVLFVAKLIHLRVYILVGTEYYKAMS